MELAATAAAAGSKVVLAAAIATAAGSKVELAATATADGSPAWWS